MTKKFWLFPLIATLSLIPQVASADDNTEEDRWIHRHAPENGMGEVGIYGGVLFPSKNHELYNPELNWQRYKTTAGSVGLRGGYYPIRFLGVEGELGLMPGRTQDDSRALMSGVRGHLVGQLGLWSVTPFVLAGVSGMGVDSDSLGKDLDLAFHYGFGLKTYLNDQVVLRFDVRDNVLASRGVDTGATNNWELLLGLSVTLGRQKEKNEPIEERVAQVIEEPIDTDGDGYIDPEDDCPLEPENFNGYEDEDGCPDELPEQVKEFMGVIEGIHFAYNSTEILPSSEATLGQALEVMEQYPGLKVSIVGHTDSRGSDSYNMKLSHRRAVAVKDWLIEHEIDSARMTTRGMGETEPLQSNATEEGRAENRRIEFLPLTEVGHVVVVD